MLSNVLTTDTDSGCRSFRMSEITRIHAGKQPRRPHYIKEWAERRGYASQAELAAELGADKSVVSRWYNGSSPSSEWQEKLAALFQCDVEAIFRHPDDDWMARFLRGRTRDEVERMKAMLEAAFPRRPDNDRKAG